MAQTLTEIKQQLAAHGLRPRHALGQNFLHDANHLSRIVAAAGVQPGELIVEVGPGTGTLTEALLDAGARVVAVELDEALATLVAQRIEASPHAGRFALLRGDVLDGKHGLHAGLLEAVRGKAFKLVANLPYQAASPLLVNLALLPREAGVMTAAVVMVQKEVAGRIAADPGGKDYGPLGIVLQARYAASVVSTLPPGCFWPPPKVSSAVVRLARLDQPRVDDLPAFAAFVHRLFGQRRKQVGTLLGRDRPYPNGVDPADRPERLTLEQLDVLRRWSGDGSGASVGLT